MINRTLLRRKDVLQEAIISYSNQGKDACQHVIAMLALPACLIFPVRAVGQEHIEPKAATVAHWFTMIQYFVSLADSMLAETYAFRPKRRVQGRPNICRPRQGRRV